MLHNRAVQIILVIASLALCGYLVWSGLNGPGRPRDIPEGVQTLTGTLIPAELSLTRRGTHILKVNNKDVAYAESATVNLRLYELTTVGVTGTYHLNTDPSDIPVFIVTSLRPVEIPSVEVELPSVGLTVRVPAEWRKQDFDDGVAFEFKGKTILRIMRTALTRLPSEGVPMFVAGYDAVRVDGKDGQSVFLQAGRTILSFTWTSRDAAQTASFAQMLRTAIVRSLASSSQSMTGSVKLPSSARSAPTGSAGSAASYAGPRPCGGPAGVLCPSGTYCAVNSPDGVGTCVQLR